MFQLSQPGPPECKNFVLCYANVQREDDIPVKASLIEAADLVIITKCSCTQDGYLGVIRQHVPALSVGLK